MTDSKTSPAPPAAPELAEPAVTAPEGRAALDTKPPPDPSTTRTPEPTRADYRRVTLGFLRGVDRILSFLLRVQRTPDKELDEFLEVMLPAAELYGPKLGPMFWAVAFGVGMASFVLGKVFQPKLPDVVASAPDEDGKPPAGGRRLGGPARYPEGAGR